ncbi:MAG: rhomboid family intramembrane serine protease [Desulfurococcales archaeon]|nr:rhomboid family intramembrane serine protease [Desulfurococcales archaeon]
MGIPVGDETPRIEPPIVNWMLIAINVLVFFIGITMPWLLLSGAVSYEDIVYSLGMVPAYIIAGERLYTLITSMFLHGSLAHLLGNMLYLYIFGDNVENVMGRYRYIIFYILSGLGATLFHLVSIAYMPRDALVNAVLTQGVSPWLIPAIGASGAISGVLGAYIILFPSATLRVVAFWGFFPVFLSLPAAVYIIIWFIYQLIMGLTTSLTGVMAGVAFWAHVGGFLTGMALTPMFVDRKRLAIAHLRYRLVYG